MSMSARIRLVLILLATVGLSVAYETARVEEVMAQSAQHYLNALTPEQSAKSLLPFDSADRTIWHFVPNNNFQQAIGHGRPGLTFREMEPYQRRLADALVSSGLSPSGFRKVASIMSLEDVLRIQEKDTVGRRDPTAYHVSLFGKPSATGTWAWRLEGHHVSLNFAIQNGRLVASSPMFFGANPHEIRQGPRSGLRVLGREEDLGRELAKSLNADQRKTALVAETAFRDILTGFQTRAKLEDQPPGLPASKLTEQQYQTLLAVLEEYASNMPPEAAAERIKRARETPKEKLFFAWAGSIEAGKGDYYRIQSPEFLVEYDNTQNGNNHSHTVWRDFNGDFGADVFALHHRQYDHGLGPTAAD